MTELKSERLDLTTSLSDGNRIEIVKKPKVSIIIPVFNTEKYIEECINSAANQDYENTEIIAINDGSTDNSKIILDKLKNNYKSLIVISTKNCGQSAARNTALELAPGELIIFLDSDDSLEKNTVSTCVKKINEYDTDIVLFEAFAYCDGTPQRLATEFNYEKDKSLHDRKMNSQSFFKEAIEKRSYIVSPCLYLYKREKLSHIKYLEGIIHEDNLFTTRLLLEIPDCNIVCISNKLFLRRIRPESIMTQNKKIAHVTGYLSVAKELLKLESYIQSSPVVNALHDFVQTILRNAITTYCELPPDDRKIQIRRECINILKRIPTKNISIKTLLACSAPKLLAIRRDNAAKRNKIK